MGEHFANNKVYSILAVPEVKSESLCSQFGQASLPIDLSLLHHLKLFGLFVLNQSLVC